MSENKRHSGILTWLLGSCCLVMAGGLTLVVWRLIETDRPLTGAAISVSEAGLKPPRIAAGKEVTLARVESALVWDSKNRRIVYEQNAFTVRPIASLTKLVAAMVALDLNLDWEREVSILPQENVIGGKLILHPGEYVTLKQLLQASLLGSANNATLALARESGLAPEEFVQAMNRKVIALGLEQTRFTEPTGLATDNVSTAYEAARLAEAAFNKYEMIAEITSQESVTYTTGGSGREHTIKNTNKLISQDKKSLDGSKTGFLYEAGYCLAARDTSGGRDLIVIVLGGADEYEALRGVRDLLQTDFAF
jgi:serine-type D-Ala-D-Ala endopeptidase (penicillin-binding protein 7)